MRLFLAIELSDAARRHLAAVQDALRPITPAGWTRTENLHLTLKFLGEVQDAAIPPLCSALGGAGAMPPFELRAQHLVCFPERGPIRIIGAELSAGEGLGELVQRIECICSDCGFARETRAYRPHVTLARARQPLASALRPKLDAAAQSTFPGPATAADRFVLMRSQLLPQGPQYSTVATCYIKLL